MSPRIRRFLFISAIAIFCFWGCIGYTYYAFSNSDLKWMAYDTISHPADFKDQNGQLFPATLLQRRFFHGTVFTNGRRTTYSADAIAEIIVDTVHSSITLHREKLKDVGNELNCVLQTGDLRMDYSPHVENYRLHDSVQIDATWYKNVYEYKMDTTATYFHSQCWRFFFNQEKGFLEMDFRGGKFYKIQ